MRKGPGISPFSTSASKTTTTQTKQQQQQQQQQQQRKNWRLKAAVAEPVPFNSDGATNIGSSIKSSGRNSNSPNAVPPESAITVGRSPPPNSPSSWLSLYFSLCLCLSLHLRVRFVASAVRPVPSTHRGFPFGFVSVRLDFETRHLAL